MACLELMIQWCKNKNILHFKSSDYIKTDHDQQLGHLKKGRERPQKVQQGGLDSDGHGLSPAKQREDYTFDLHCNAIESHTHTHTHTHSLSLSLSLSPKASIYPIMLANWASLDINEKSISDLSLRSFFKDIFPVADGEKSACNAGDPSSIPGEGRSSGEGNGKPTPVFLPGESPGQRSLAGYSPWGCKELDMTEWLTLSL